MTKVTGGWASPLDRAKPLIFALVLSTGSCAFRLPDPADRRRPLDDVLVDDVLGEHRKHSVHAVRGLAHLSIEGA